MNLTSGIFPTPRAGIYSFTFNGSACFPRPSPRISLNVGMYLNGISASSGQGDEVGTVDQFEIFSIQSTLNLQKGKELLLQISDISTGIKYLNTTYFFTVN